MIYQLQSSLFSPLFEAITEGERKIKTSGLWGSSEAFFLSRLAREGRPFCVVAPSYAQADRFYRELRYFLELDATAEHPSPELLFFPPGISFRMNRRRRDPIGSRSGWRPFTG
ncbi:MAG: hypothetical protein MPW17_17270 [Candidatus Manganitrophus sp.]|nr:MAG: hypothetical protein MPW17_17270 [Candidatus Manganitrophus sp.]